MATLFFAHGTGVRDEGYRQTKSDIERGLQKAGVANVKVAGVSWGLQAGVNVTDKFIADMLPTAGAMGNALTNPEEQAAIWASLMDDPLFELRLIALKSAAPERAIAGQPLASEEFKASIRSLADIDGPAGGVSRAALGRAIRWLADGDGSRVVTDAAAVAGAPTNPTLIAAAAHALVAYALGLERGELGVGPDALYVLEEREALILQLVQALSGEVKGIDEWFKKKLTEWALAKATAYGRDRRSGLMNVVSPGVGDILLTQRRPDVVKLLGTEIAKIEGEVIVIGHSLGGVHLVNLLSGPSRPANVTKLITAGSQSAFFTACNAMAHIGLDASLPGTFPPWLNFYDRSDFLSFRAQSFFKNGLITDHEVSSGVSFPDSHGAYWRNPAVYKKIATFLP